MKKPAKKKKKRVVTEESVEEEGDNNEDELNQYDEIHNEAPEESLNNSLQQPSA
jgi:hypothetical protein